MIASVPGERSRLEPSALTPLTGEERFTGDQAVELGDANVLDFWRWAFGDLRMNVVRGVLAEYLVARAVGDPTPLRHAWADYDVITPNETTIEVKSAARLQSWTLAGLSRVSFSGLWGRRWSEEDLRRSEEPELLADVFVFAIQTCTEPDEYDPLNVDQWEFYVVSRYYIEGRVRPGASIGMPFLTAAAESPWGTKSTLETLAEDVEAIRHKERFAEEIYVTPLEPGEPTPEPEIPHGEPDPGWDRETLDRELGKTP